MQPSQQEVSSAICGFAASAKLSISSFEARCSLWLSTARLALSPRCGMKTTCPSGPSILRGVAGACFFAVTCSPPTSVPWGKGWLGGVTVGRTEGQGGEGVRREEGTGNRLAQRDSSAPVPPPAAVFLLFFAALEGGREDVWRGRCPLTSAGKMQWR